MVVTEAHELARSQRKADRPEHLHDAIHVARDNERRRISAEIHDGAVQWIVGALYRVKACGRLTSEPDIETLRADLRDIEASLRQSISDLRRMIADLRPLPLEDLGLVAALGQAAARIDEDGIRCRIVIEGQVPDLTPGEERAAFGIIHEAMINARKHADASSLLVRLICRQAIRAEVIDNGRGFDARDARGRGGRPDHIGLEVMKERAESLGAHLEIHSHPGRGTSVALVFRPESQRLPAASWR